MQDNVSNKKHTRAQSKDTIAEVQILGHLKGGVRNVRPIEKIRDVREKKKWH